MVPGGCPSALRAGGSCQGHCLVMHAAPSPLPGTDADSAERVAAPSAWELRGGRASYDRTKVWPFIFDFGATEGRVGQEGAPCVGVVCHHTRGL